MPHLHRVLVAVLLLTACQEKQGPTLPPATGKGAPAAPAIPSLSQLQAKAAVDRPPQSTAAGTGTLRPRHLAALGPKETGLITAIMVDEGDTVKKGELLFRLDSATFSLAVDQAKAAVATVQVQLDSAQLDFNRTKALRERGSVPPDALDQAKSRLDAATTAMAQARAAQSLAERRAANMVLTAPFAGMITERRMNVGETATLMPPSVVLVLQNLEELELRARLPESALARVRENSEITARFPSVNVSRKLRIKRISPTIDARTRTIEIVADVDNTDHRLLAGMLAEVMYDHDDEQAAAATPSEAVNAAR